MTEEGFVHVTYLVVHVVGGSVRGIYPRQQQGNAEQLADALWAETGDQEIDEVRVFELKAGISPNTDYLTEKYQAGR